MVIVVGLLVTLSITEANADTPEPDCPVAFASPRSVAVCSALDLSGCPSSSGCLDR
jgi:hypothetical protein